MYAFQNLREERCQKNRTLDIGDVRFLMKPEGEDTAMRDTMMRRNYNEGRNVFEGDDEESNLSRWDQFRELFAYDAEDEADNWWVQWGLLQEHSESSHGDTKISSLEFV
jgi:salicylate hydroxylase